MILSVNSQFPSIDMMLILTGHHEVDVCNAGVSPGVESLSAVQGDDVAGPREKEN